MVKSLARGFGAGIAALWVGIASPAWADGLADECRVVNDSKASGCVLERNPDDWTLTTSLLVGGGGKRGVKAVEQQFCEAARHRGVQGRVVRWNAIGAVEGAGAKMEWTCGAPAVASAPPRARR